MNFKHIDTFIKIVNKTIDNGNINLLEKAIKKYQNTIPNKYIKCAKVILDELLIEKMEILMVNSNKLIF
jgi:hypothetical protein